MIVLAVVALAGLGISFLLPENPLPSAAGASHLTRSVPEPWTPRPDVSQRPGSRVVISWSSQPLPSGSLNVANEPYVAPSGARPLTRPSKPTGEPVAERSFVEYVAHLDAPADDLLAGRIDVGDDEVQALE